MSRYVAWWALTFVGVVGSISLAAYYYALDDRVTANGLMTTALVVGALGWIQLRRG